MVKIAIKTYCIGLFFMLSFFMIVRATETNTYARKSYVTSYNIDLINGNKTIDFITETGHEWVNIPTETKYNIGQEVLITFDRNGTTDIINDDYVVLIEKHNVNER